MSSSPEAVPRVGLTRGGILLDQGETPLFVASVHYWRHERADWKALLGTVRELGFRGIDTYLPWSEHEFESGGFDFGAREPRLDVGAFLREAQAHGLFAIVRPGPHINAELTCFGIPKRVIWQRPCQARSPNDRPVILPIPPLAFPVPSYASEAFLNEACEWLKSVAEQLAPLQYPDGPVVLIQVDNEAALYFRDGVFDQDYHPDAVAAFRVHLKQRYGRLELLREAYANPALSFAGVDPPRQLRLRPASELRRSTDWAEFQEHLIAAALARFRQALVDGGLERALFTHNLPPGFSATPLDTAGLARVVDLVGMDIYQGANEAARSTLAESVSELYLQCDERHQPTFAAELGVGFPPYFPPIDAQDSEFCALTAIAYGVSGFNLYMAVERDRWIGAPIDDRGGMRPGAEFYRKLMAALEALRFGSLRRRLEVGVLVPKSERRFARVLHGFGPLSAAFFSVAGAGARVSALEPEDPELPQVVMADAFAERLRRVLEERHVPWTAVTDAQLSRVAPTLAQTLVVSGGHLDRALARDLAQLWSRKTHISIGPVWPAFTPELTALDLDASAARSHLAAHLTDEALAAEIDRALANRALRALPVSGKIHATLYDDQDATPRVLFLINAGDEQAVAEVDLGDRQLLDRLTGEVVPASERIPVARRTTRMLEIVKGS